MAELHPNQIPFEAPEPALANLAYKKDYLSRGLSNLAGVIEDAVEFNMKLDDIKLAARVKANMAAGIQNIKTGDAVGGDYTALKNDALALYQQSFEGAPQSAIKRYMRQNPTELQQYELDVEAVTAEKENKAADVRIRKEMSNIASRVALGQLSWTEAVNALHVLGGDKITSDQYEAYTKEMRSDIDRYQLTMYLSGDMQSNLKALDMLQDPNVWETLSATDRARAKAAAQSNIDQMIKEMAAKKEKKENEPYNTIENSVLNSAYMWRDLGDGAQLTQLKEQMENLALTNKLDLFDSKGNKITTLKYSDLQPREWGKIRDELDKVNLHSLKQQEYDTQFNVTAQKLEANLEQGYANSTMSNSEELNEMLKDPRATDILKPEKVAQMQLKADEFTDKLAASLRSTYDVETPVSKSVALWGLIRTADESPWAKANNLTAWAEYNKFVSEQPRFQTLLNKIKMGIYSNSPNPDQIDSGTITTVANKILDNYNKDTEVGKALRKNPTAKVLYESFKKADEDFHLKPGDVAGMITGDYSRAEIFKPLYEGKQTFQDLLAFTKEDIFNGEYASKLVSNSRLEYVVGLASLMASKKDLVAFSQELGYPNGIVIDPKFIADAVRTVGSVLERSGVRDQLVNDDTRKEDAKALEKALMLDKLNRTPEQIAAWNNLVYAAEYGQSHKDGAFSRWFDTPSSSTFAEPEKMKINVPAWTNRKGNK